MRSVIRVGPLVSKAEMFLLHGCCISLQTKETRTRFKKIRAKIQNYKRRTSPQTKCAAEYVIFIRYYGKKKERLVYITRNNDKMGVMKSSQSLALEIDAIDADFCAFAFDARAGQLVDDATHSVHLAVDVAAINPQSS